MDASDDKIEFELQRAPVQRYFYNYTILMILVTGIWVFGLGIVAAILYAIFIGPWLPRRQADSLKYWIEDGALRVDQGVYFLKRKSIPLDRITDVVLAQGPLMRFCGIWGLQIQTAGRGQGMPEAMLYGLVDPEQTRDRIIAARNESVADRKMD